MYEEVFIVRYHGIMPAPMSPVTAKSTWAMWQDCSAMPERVILYSKEALIKSFQQATEDEMTIMKTDANKRTLILSSILVVFGLILLLWALPELITYTKTVKVTATVAHCEPVRVYRDGDRKLRYEIYVNYEFDGRDYDQVYWKTQNSRKKVGGQTTVRIDPEHPSQPVTSFSVGALLVALGFLIYGLRYFLPAVFKSLSRPRTTGSEEEGLP